MGRRYVLLLILLTMLPVRAHAPSIPVIVTVLRTGLYDLWRVMVNGNYGPPVLCRKPILRGLMIGSRVACMPSAMQTLSATRAGEAG